MNSILWIVFAACFSLQANADYWVEIKGITSFIDAIKVTADDPKEGDIKLTNYEKREGSTFKATIKQGLESLRAEVEGEVCDVNDQTPAGLIAKIFHMAVGVDDCPFPEGDLPVTKKLQIEGNVLDQYITSDLGDLIVEAKIYGKDSDGSTHDVFWLIEIGQLVKRR